MLAFLCVDINGNTQRIIGMALQLKYNDVHHEDKYRTQDWSVNIIHLLSPLFFDDGMRLQ